MDPEVLVYVNLEGEPILVGRLWARMRKGRNRYGWDQAITHAGIGCDDLERARYQANGLR